MKGNAVLAASIGGVVGGILVVQVFLETGRLVLRRFTMSDADNLAGLDGDPDVMHFITGGRPTSREEILNDFLPAFLGYYERYPGFGFWAAIGKPAGQFLGWFQFRPPEGDAPAEAEHGDVEYALSKADWEQREAAGPGGTAHT